MRKHTVCFAGILGLLLLLSFPPVRGATAAATDDAAAITVFTPDEDVEVAAEVATLATPVVHTCSLGAFGGSCLFDLTATANGLLRVDTEAARTGDRWRACIIEVGIAQQAPCNVGSGSSTAFSGLAQKTLESGKKYGVIVLCERPLSGAFPAIVQIRFDGPVRIASRQQRPLAGWYTGVHIGPNNAFAIEVRKVSTRWRVTGIMVDTLGCPGTDLHAFNLRLSPGIRITTRQDGLPGFSARGLAVPLSSGHAHSLDIDGVFLNADGAEGTLEQALGGLELVSGNARCKKIWRATTAPSDDFDGWNDAAELRLGSRINSLPSTPEHKIVPTTDFNGPDTCHDSADNDDDELVDGADPGCQ